MVYNALHRHGMERYYRYREKDYIPGTFQPEASEHDYRYLDSAEFKEAYLHEKQPGIYFVALYIKGIHCSACIWVIERIAHLHSGILDVRLQYGASTVDITFDEAKISLSEIAHLLESLGYVVSPVDDARKKIDKQNRADLSRLGVSALCAAHTMIIAVSLYEGDVSGMESQYEWLLRGVSLLLTLPVVTYCAAPFYRAAIAGLLVGRPHVDLPISVGILLSFFLSLYNTFQSGTHVYFESVCALVFFLLAGRYLQKVVFERSRKSADLQSAFFPLYALRVQGCEDEAVLLRALRIDDIIRVPAGDRIPVDGLVERGDSAVDQSVLNGEATPVRVQSGDPVFAGTLNAEGELYVRVQKTFQQSRAYSLLEKLRDQSSSESEISYADRLSFFFVGAVLLLALIAFFVWLPSGMGTAVNVTVALLIVSCPCAFALASPLASAVLTGRGARSGIFIKRPSALLDLRQCAAVLFDKTGTLTFGKLRIQQFEMFGVDISRQRALSVILALESVTKNHPVAKAFLESELCMGILPANDLKNVESIPGRGVRGVDQEGMSWSLERAQDRGLFEGVVLTCNAVKIAHAIFSDQVRPGAIEFLSGLRARGIESHIASGDAVTTVRSVGEQLGVDPDKAHGALLPDEKKSLVESLKQSGVVFVGDGVNDAAALAAANVSIGVKSPAEVTLESADIFISREIIHSLDEIWVAAQMLHRTIACNMLFSLCYNVLGIALALAGFMTPLIAAVLMPVSSLTVILSSASLRAFR